MELAERKIRDELRAANAAWTDSGRDELYKEYFVLSPNGVTFFKVSCFCFGKLFLPPFFILRLIHKGRLEDCQGGEEGS